MARPNRAQLPSRGQPPKLGNNLVGGERCTLVSRSLCQGAVSALSRPGSLSGVSVLVCECVCTCCIRILIRDFCFAQLAKVRKWVRRLVCSSNSKTNNRSSASLPLWIDKPRSELRQVSASRDSIRYLSLSYSSRAFSLSLSSVRILVPYSL